MEQDYLEVTQKRDFELTPSRVTSMLEPYDIYELSRPTLGSQSDLKPDHRPAWRRKKLINSEILYLQQENSDRDYWRDIPVLKMLHDSVNELIERGHANNLWYNAKENMKTHLNRILESNHKVLTALNNQVRNFKQQ